MNHQLRCGDSCIEGVVTNRKGIPISGVVVMISSGTSPFPDIAAVTNQRGWYRLSNLVEGSYEVVATIEDFVEQKRTVQVRENEIVVLDFILD